MKRILLIVIIILAGVSTWRARINANVLADKVDSIYRMPELAIWYSGDKGKAEEEMASIATSFKFDRNAAADVELMNGILFVLAITLLVLEFKDRKSQQPGSVGRDQKASQDGYTAAKP
jgi:hypothetical protein